MKPNIHPKYYNDCKVTCACGNTYITGSILQSISVEVCGKCHPFYTGKAKFIDTEGRVDKYVKKVKFAESERAKKALKMAKKKEVEKIQVDRPVTLKDMLKQASK